MARSKTELSSAVMQRLALLAAGENPTSEDAKLIESRYDGLLAQLREDGLAYWPSTTRAAEEIPDVVFGPLTDVLSDMIASAFGKDPIMAPDPFNGRMMSVGTAGMRALRRHLAKGPSGEPTRASYY